MTVDYIYAYGERPMSTIYWMECLFVQHVVNITYIQNTEHWKVLCCGDHTAVDVRSTTGAYH